MVKYGMHYDNVLQQFGVRRDNEPLEVKARVLPEPVLCFRNASATINNSSWDLCNKKNSRNDDANFGMHVHHDPTAHSLK